MLRLQIVNELSTLHSRYAWFWFLVDKINQQEIDIQNLVLMIFFLILNSKTSMVLKV